MAKRATHKPEGKTPVLAPAIDTPSSGDLSSPAEPVIQPEHETGLIDPPAGETPQVDTNQPNIIETTNPPDDSVNADEGDGEDEGSADTLVRSDEPHPAIELAKRHKTRAGKPREGHPRYYTPPPYDVFAKKKR